MSAVITAVLIGAGLLALAIWVEIREGRPRLATGATAAPGSHNVGWRPINNVVGKSYRAEDEEHPITETTSVLRGTVLITNWSFS
jgi:hypothetical protein